MSNIHIDDGIIGPLIGCNRFRVRVHLLKTKRICTIKREKGDATSGQSHIYVFPCGFLFVI